ncbi:MAG: hypothetical protein AAB525_00430 [Patescibacteria group bacterium]
MQVEIDQSIKIEQISRDTIIAFSNSISYAVTVPAKAKKQIKQQFRILGKPHLFYYRTFAAAVVLLIKNYLSKIDAVVIDREYSGREKLIKDMILEMLKSLRCKQPQIYFRQIGKKSKAHKVAYLTMKKQRKADIVLTIKELQELIFRQK